MPGLLEYSLENPRGMKGQGQAGRVAGGCGPGVSGWVLAMGSRDGGLTGRGNLSEHILVLP